jgi:hypothetical protein
VSQTTFYPLMASPVVERQLAATLGKVDYRREARFYEIISEVLASATVAPQSALGSQGSGLTEGALRREGGNSTDSAPSRLGPCASPVRAPYTFGSAWTFNASRSTMIDEYIVDYEEYPAIGAGGFSYLDGSLYANVFSVSEYIQRIEQGQMSVKQTKRFSKTDQMRYRLMMQLFGLRLDKVQWERDFGVSVAAGLPAEYAFFKAARALAVDDATQITLTPRGRYLMVALMREFFIGVNGLRDSARAALPPEERELLFN